MHSKVHFWLPLIVKMAADHAAWVFMAFITSCDSSSIQDGRSDCLGNTKIDRQREEPKGMGGREKKRGGREKEMCVEREIGDGVNETEWGREQMCTCSFFWFYNCLIKQEGANLMRNCCWTKL